MVAQFSLITSIVLAATTTSSSAQSSSSVHSSSASSSSATITSVASVGTIGLSSPKNSTSTSIKAQTTVSLFNACSGSDSTCKSLDDLTYFGSVVTADKSSTIFALGCSQNGKNATTECFSHPITVTQGPSVFARVDESGAVPTTVSCDIKSRTESAVCAEKYKYTADAALGTVTASAGAAQNSGNSSVQTTTYKFDSSMIHYNKLVVTQGAEKLNGNSSIATKTPSAPPTATNAGTSTTSKGAAGALTAPVASLAGITAILFAVFSF